MNAIEIADLSYAYKKADAVQGLNLTVPKGKCYGLFGRNGAGKTTTMKCLLNLLRPQAGKIRVFGFDPARDEVEVKRRLAYVPDAVAFYPWMSVRETLDYLCSFRDRWNRDTAGGKEVECGWVKDKFGLSWQITPTILLELMQDPRKAPHVMKAMMKMVKLDVDVLKQAGEQAA